ncbi:hypothetical protein RB195_004132 [Necator americanus]|uniref:Secreted protein n=1 Tax=Necator americanus TaxID=51031 RepID=A0ABR1BJY4_NECAM
MVMMMMSVVMVMMMEKIVENAVMMMMVVPVVMVIYDNHLNRLTADVLSGADDVIVLEERDLVRHSMSHKKRQLMLAERQGNMR